MSYEDFYNACVMKGYQYKNFKLAYDKWTSNTKKFSAYPAKATNTNKSLQQKNKEFVEGLFSKNMRRDAIDVDIVQEVENAK